MRGFLNGFFVGICLCCVLAASAKQDIKNRAKLVTDVETDPYRNLDYDVPNTYYMDEEEKPKKCSCYGCTWERR